MRLWNGWGDHNEYKDVKLNSSLSALLSGLLGPGKPLPIASIEDVIAKIPKSNIPKHNLISTDSEIRLRHARGQSLPDWLIMHSGKVEVFPDGVAFPKSIEEVQALLAFASKNEINVIPYGGGTSVVGHINPEKTGKLNLTISMSKMTKLIELDRISLLAKFESGASGPQIEEQLNKEGFTLGHFPQSWEYSTLGGWIASRSSGQQSLKYGRIENLFAGGKIETPRGTLEIPTCPASSAGPNLKEFILGSEGRLGVITEATVRVSPVAKRERFGAVFFPSWESGMSAVRTLIQKDFNLSMMRLSNQLETLSLIYMSGKTPEEINKLDKDLSAKGIKAEKVILTFGETDTDEMFIRQINDVCSNFDGVLDESELMKNWKHGRFKAPYLREPLGVAGYAVDTIETAVNWKDTQMTMKSMEEHISQALREENENIFVYSHLSHVYKQGSSIYTTYIFRIGDSYEEGLDRWRKIKTAGSKAIMDAGGTISHQHGVGLDHMSYLPIEKGRLGVDAIDSVCLFFDPEKMMNQGKLIQKGSDR